MGAAITHAYLRRSPKTTKKWRVELPSHGTHVDFGQRGASDFTLHKDPERMRRYLVRHAAIIPEELRDGPVSVPGLASRVTESRRESWDDPTTPGFWSRWLLWAYPSRKEAKAALRRQQGIEVHEGSAAKVRSLRAF